MRVIVASKSSMNAAGHRVHEGDDPPFRVGTEPRGNLLLRSGQRESLGHLDRHEARGTVAIPREPTLSEPAGPLLEPRGSQGVEVVLAGSVEGDGRRTAAIDSSAPGSPGARASVATAGIAVRSAREAPARSHGRSWWSKRSGVRKVAMTPSATSPASVSSPGSSGCLCRSPLRHSRASWQRGPSCGRSDHT